jgi:hypothetical protein
MTSKDLDGILPPEVAASCEMSGAGDAMMPAHGKAKWQVRGVRKANSHGGQNVGNFAVIAADLQRRIRAGDVEAVVCGPRDAKRQAKAARPGRDHLRRCVGPETAICSHPFNPGHRIEGAQENAAGEPIRLAADVHAKVAPVDGVHIRMSRWSEEDGVPGSWPAVRMRRGIRQDIVRAKVCLDFNNASGQHLTPDPANQQFAEQARRHQFRRILKKGSPQQMAGKAGLCASPLR